MATPSIAVGLLGDLVRLAVREDDHGLPPETPGSPGLDDAAPCVMSEPYVTVVRPDGETDAVMTLPRWCSSLGLEHIGLYRLASGILQGMPKSTTIKVSVRTRDALRELADREGLTFDAQIAKLVRRERRRIIGAQLASAPLDADDKAVLDASASDVADASG